MKFEPKFSAFADKVYKSFADQAVMRFIGAEMSLVEPGKVDIRLPFRKELSQQNGFLHAGITSTIADSACGYAALSLMAEDSGVVSVEFKVNLLSPATGEYFIAEGRVLRSGKFLTVVNCDVFAIKDSSRKIIATMLGTMMSIKY